MKLKTWHYPKVEAETTVGRYRIVAWIMFDEPVYSMLLPNGIGGWDYVAWGDDEYRPKRACRAGTRLCVAVRRAMGHAVPDWMAAV